jgi:parallel beta-helix repeat protein
VWLTNNANVYILEAANVNNWVISGGEWDGNRANQASNLAAFNIDTCDNFTVRDTIIHDIDKTGGEGKALRLTDATNFRILHNYIYDIGDAGVASGGTAIQIRNDTSNGVVDGNVIHDTDAGIYLYASDAKVAHTIKVVNNYIYNITRDGISLYAKLTGIVRNNVIDGNTIIDASRDGNHAHIKVGDDGITRDNVISNNNLYEGATQLSKGIAAIYDTGEVYRNTITGNVVYHMGNHGITIQGSGNIISNNVVDELQTANRAGIVIDGGLGEGDNNLVIGNMIYNCQHGIDVDDNADNNLIKANYIDTMAGKGIRIINANCNETGVMNNVCINITNAAEIDDNGTNSYIHDNYEDEGGWTA